jgi:DNA-3-methyladenine glycosylase I
MKERKRCSWAGSDPLYVRYHDEEWGRPVHDDRHFFEMLTLEGAQAGLSWLTILRKRENYRRAFAGFDPRKVAKFDAKKRAALMRDAGIVRNRLKIDSAIANAHAVLAVREEHGSLDAFLWGLVPGAPLRRRDGAVPAEAAESRNMSKTLKRAGFRFVGPTVCYAFMQAVGMADDHSPECFRYAG